MRVAGLLVAGVLAVGVSPAAAVAAEDGWREYTNEALGYAVEMPGAPVEGTGVYRSRFVPAAPSRYAIFRNATNIFSVAVIEMGKDVPPLSALGEADFIITQFGEVVLNNVSRTGNDWGRFITVECDENYVVLPEGGGPDPAGRIRGALLNATGIQCPTGSRMTVAVLYKAERLYLAVGVNLPGPNARSGAGGHFASSLAWAGSNRSAMDLAQRGAGEPAATPPPAR